MAKQTINIGTSANDGTGSTLREAFDITNDNFTELYDGTGGLLHKIEGTNFTGSLLIGHNTTGTISSATYNTGIGIGALDALTSGNSNVAVGTNAGTLITSGTQNILLGYAAGDAITTGHGNIAIGSSALSAEDGHGKNIAIGTHNLLSQNAGADAYNIAIGHQAGMQVSTGINNTLIGGLAGDALTTGERNVVVGHGALGAANGSESRNTAIGWSALALQDNDGNSANTAVGYNAGASVTSGINNTIIGALAGNTIQDGSNNIIIGKSAAASGASVSNEVTIGNSNITNVRIPSDSTLKIGADGDLQLEHVSSNSFIKNTAVGDLYIENQVDDKDIIFRSDDGSGGVTEYFKLSGVSSRVQFSKNQWLTDNVKILLGNNDDLQIYHDSFDSYIENFTNHLRIINQANDGDIKFFSDDGSGGKTEYFRVDGGENRIVYSQDGRHLDNIKSMYGSGADLQIYHDGSNSYINNFVGELNIWQNADDKDIVFASDNGSGGVTEYIRLDGSDGNVKLSKQFAFLDNVTASFGNAADLKIYHDSSNSYIQAEGTGDLVIEQKTDDKDILFKSDDGSGGVTTYFSLDGSIVRNKFSKNLHIPDNIKAEFGANNDLQIYHGGTNSVIDNLTGDLIITNFQDDGDIVFKTDNSSGGTTTYFKLDGANHVVSIAKPFFFQDNVKIYIGNSFDLEIYHDVSNSYIQQKGTGDLIIENTTDDGDIVFRSDDGSGGVATYMFLDGSVGLVQFFKSTKHSDNIVANFGNSNDAQIYHSGTNGFINNNTGDLYVTNFQDDGDIIFRSDDGSGGITEYFRVDGGDERVLFSKEIRTIDNVKIQAGTGGDLDIFHTGSNATIDNATGDLIIQNSADDEDIIFKCDDGGGGTTTYFKLDGVNKRTRFEEDILIIDNKKIKIGAGADLQIYHSGSDSYIDQLGTGDLYLRNLSDDKDIIFQSDDGSGGHTEYFRLDGGFSSPFTVFPDNSTLAIGSDLDLRISHNGNDTFLLHSGTGDLYIANTTDDEDVNFQCDDGSGGVTTYIQLDGSEVSTKILTQKVIMSNLPTSDPSNAGQLYNDSGVLKVSAG